MQRGITERVDMAQTEHQNLSNPSETRTFAHGKAEFIQIGGGTVGRFTLQPGWHWAKDVKPLVGTSLCQVPHFQYQVSGRIHVLMEDGTEYEFGPGDVCVIPPGHDAWVVGDEPVILIDWYAACNHTKP